MIARLKQYLALEINQLKGVSEKICGDLGTIISLSPYLPISLFIKVNFPHPTERNVLEALASRREAPRP